ncbi:MAG: hypothetical protein KDE19_01095, partial [Caldilineaceae bacterium]|nr:hypothetical protein [Caldilineaceae bacterium]
MQLSQLPESAMQYPLREKIGDPGLFVGRAHELRDFHQWIAGMPRLLSQSRALLGRRKSGKTAFVQRLFNQIWSANGDVIPFYFSVPETFMWYPEFVLLYYRTFATQYISFRERDPDLLLEPLSMEQIRAYGEAHGIAALVNHVNLIVDDQQKGYHGLMWDTAYRAPHRTADRYDQRILVIIDEFQYLSTNIFAREDLSGDPIVSMPGSYHEVSESKVAPMLATGSYVGWMVDIMRTYLEAGRLQHINFSPYLTEEEGLVAVYTYAEALQEPITNETAVQLNTLCKADPFFISCVMRSNFPNRDLTTTQGVVEAVNHEVANRDSYLSRTWEEYIERTVKRINEKYGKHILLHLSKHNDRYWTPRELKQALQLEEDETVIHSKLISLVKGDLLEWGSSDIRFRGLQDGTLNLILRHRFEEEIMHHQPNFASDFNAQLAAVAQENRSLRGKLSHIQGQVTEFQLAVALRSRKRFRLEEFFTGADDDTPLHLLDVQTRVLLQRADGGTKELDIVAQANDARVLLVEVKHRQEPSTEMDVADFLEKVTLYQTQHPDRTVLPAFLSLGGFTHTALEQCR